MPSISGLSPDHVTAGGSGFTLTVNGSNFISSSVVNWNSSARPTNFVNSGQLTASISASDVATVGQAQVSVFNPAPAGGTSGSLAFSITGVLPSITALSPPSRAAGGLSFTLTVNGTNFNSGTVVRWNGQERTTQFVNATQVTASISAADTAAAGLANVTIFNAGTGGGESGAKIFPVFLNLSTADLLYDATEGANHWVYASIPNNGASGTANSITAIDPATGKVLDTPAPVLIPNNPDPARLALSDNGQFLYFGLNNAASVRRLSLSKGPALDPVTISLGSDNLRVETLQVLQESFGNSIAVARKLSNPAPGDPRNAGVAIYDADTGIRSTTTIAGSSPNVIQLCATPSILFGLNAGDGPAPGFYLLNVGPSGVTQTYTTPELSGNDISLGITSAGVERIFSTSGQVLNASDQIIVYSFPVTGPVKADTSGHRVFYLVQNPPPSNATWTIRAFNLDTYAPIGTLDIPGVNGNPSSLILWGTPAGLAFRTDQNQVFLIKSSFVPGP